MNICTLRLYDFLWLIFYLRVYIDFLVLLFNNKKSSQILFFKIKKNILNYMEGYYCKFISFSFSFLLLSNIGMETKYSFSFPIPTYQTPPQSNHSTCIAFYCSTQDTYDLEQML